MQAAPDAGSLLTPSFLSGFNSSKIITNDIFRGNYHYPAASANRASPVSSNLSIPITIGNEHRTCAVVSRQNRTVRSLDLAGSGG